MAEFEIDLPDWLYARFERLAAIEGIPVDELVNRVVREEIERTLDEPKREGPVEP